MPTRNYAFPSDRLHDLDAQRAIMAATAYTMRTHKGVTTITVEDDNPVIHARMADSAKRLAKP